MHPILARDGHLIYCYGDCERKYDEALSALRESHTGDVMKNMWLDAHNKQINVLSSKPKLKLINDNKKNK